MQHEPERSAHAVRSIGPRAHSCTVSAGLVLQWRLCPSSRLQQPLTIAFRWAHCARPRPGLLLAARHGALGWSAAQGTGRVLPAGLHTRMAYLMATSRS